MQPGLDSADRRSRQVLDFLQLVALGIVQQHDMAVFLAQLPQRSIQAPEFFQPFVVLDRVEIAREVGEPLPRQVPFVDEVHALAHEAPVLVDEQVIHHAGQPRSRILDMDEFVEHAESLDQEFLEQVLRFGLRARESPRQPVKAVEMRPYHALEYFVLVRIAHCTAECIAAATPFGKDVSCYS